MQGLLVEATGRPGGEDGAAEGEEVGGSGEELCVGSGVSERLDDGGEELERSGKRAKRRLARLSSSTEAFLGRSTAGVQLSRQTREEKTLT